MPQLSRQSLIPGGSVEISHENLFGDSESLSVSLSASDWRNPSADLGFQMSFTQPFYAPNTTRNVQVGGVLLLLSGLLRWLGSCVHGAFVHRAFAWWWCGIERL